MKEEGKQVHMIQDYIERFQAVTLSVWLEERTDYAKA